ncbi:MAG: hypothetical protein AVDCRST_MAG87-3295, partial [uncultured Thermomicrobiales bacterium]
APLQRVSRNDLAFLPHPQVSGRRRILRWRPGSISAGTSFHSGV